MTTTRDLLLNLKEMLILEFSVKGSTVISISDYPSAEHPAPHRVFAKVTFTDVSEAFIVRYKRPPLPLESHFMIIYGPQPIVFQSIRETTKQGVEFWFDRKIGGVSFKYGNVAASFRSARAEIAPNNRWQYYDLKTGEPFDFCYPFGQADRADQEG